MQNPLVFYIIAMSTYGIGLSGGDRIWIELARRFGIKYRVNIYLWEEGRAIAKREGLKKVKYVLWSALLWARFGFFINYFARIVIGILNAFKLNLSDSPSTIVYSASEFWQDSLPAFILKLRYPKIQLVAAWYQTAPNPFRVRYRFKAFLYWFVQLPIKPIISKLADVVIVNNEDEKKQFPKMAQMGKVFVMLGAVDWDKIKDYQSKHKSEPKIYDGVFQGRFHPQKGVLELIDIWKIVVESKSDAMLAMIGDGPLMNDVRFRIKDLKLEKNIKLFGYVFDGPKKYRIFQQSKIVLHPAAYDSGGMASAEAMAFGLPCVGFNLPSYQSYYPKGMVKIKKGNLKYFADAVSELLKDKKLYDNVAKDGREMINQFWSWDNRTKQFLNNI